MTLTAPDITLIGKAAGRWECGEYVCGGLVAIACFGEFIADFTDWVTDGLETRKRRLAKISTLLLIAALAAELVCLVRTNNLSELRVSALNESAEKSNLRGIALAKEIAKSNAKAKQAEEGADVARKRTAELLEQMQVRDLNAQQQRSIAMTCRRFAGQRVVLVSAPQDAEAFRLKQEIATALGGGRDGAGLTFSLDARFLHINELFFGIHVEYPARGSSDDLVRGGDLARALTKSLRQNGKLDVTLVSAPESMESAPIIKIGIRPATLLK